MALTKKLTPMEICIRDIEARMPKNILEKCRYGEMKNNGLITIRPDIRLLQNICKYAISDNASVTYKDLETIDLYLRYLPLDLQNDINLGPYLRFISLAILHRSNNVTIKEELVDSIMMALDPEDSHKLEMYIADITSEISSELITTLYETINKLVIRANSTKYLTYIMDLANELKSRSPELTMDCINLIIDANDVFKDTIKNLHKEQPKNATIITNTDSIETISMDMYKRHSNSNGQSRLKTGLSGLNKILNGGFEKGRQYGFFTKSGGGKSITLMDLADQICRHNDSFELKDKTKIPAVGYLSFENSSYETLDRLVKMRTNYNLSDCCSYDDYRRLMEQGAIIGDTKNKTQLYLKYNSPNSQNTNYVKQIYKEMLDLGYETTVFLVDYLELINSVKRHTDSRNELGAVILELKAIAEELDIVILIAGQINREGDAKIAECARAKQVNAVDCLESCNVAESSKIVNNIDGVFMILQEYDESNEEKWLGIKLTKQRFEVGKDIKQSFTGGYTIHHKYADPKGIKLLEDENRPIGGQTWVYKIEKRMDTEDTSSVDMSIPINHNSGTNGKSCMEEMAIEPKQTTKEPTEVSRYNAYKFDIKLYDEELKLAKLGYVKRIFKTAKCAEVMVYENMYTGEVQLYHPDYNNFPKHSSETGFRTPTSYSTLESENPDTQISISQAMLNNDSEQEFFAYANTYAKIPIYSDMYDGYVNDGTNKVERVLGYFKDNGYNFTEEAFPHLKEYLIQNKTIDKTQPLILPLSVKINQQPQPLSQKIHPDYIGTVKLLLNNCTR